MTKFYDGSKLLSIEMTDTANGAHFEADFFEAAGLEYNADLGAYKVEDVEYLADYAQSYADGTNSDIEYTVDEDGNVVVPGFTVDYDIEVM
jgi:hypothetical protein|nr:MAG TPA: hypothetical protein [Bacteriophage sp.]